MAQRVDPPSAGGGNEIPQHASGRAAGEVLKMIGGDDSGTPNAQERGSPRCGPRGLPNAGQVPGTVSSNVVPADRKADTLSATWAGVST